MSRSILKLVGFMCAIVTLGVVVVGSASPARAASDSEAQGLCDFFGCEGGDAVCVSGTFRWPDGREVDFECGDPEPPPSGPS